MALLKYFSALSYTRLNDLFCTDFGQLWNYGRFTTLHNAKVACDEDDNCKYVYDVKCDNVNTFYLCSKSNSLKPAPVTGSCVYEKQGDHYHL